MDHSFDLLIQIGIFGTVVVAILAASRQVEASLNLRRRLRAEQDPRGEGPSSLVKKLHVSNPILAWIQASSSVGATPERQKLARRLALAGFESPAAPVWYVIARFSLAIGLPFAFLVTQRFVEKPMQGAQLILFALGLCAVGLVSPRAFIDNRANAKRQAIENEFPDALDLMVICVEAGLGLEAAFLRVRSEIHETHPRVAHEFDLVSSELRAGQTRADALRAMAERTDTDIIRSFVALLIQTDALGTSIGQTLRTYSQEMRQTRYLRAEEKAMRIPVLLTVPLVVCILPVIITALLLPAVIDVMTKIIPVLHGAHP